ncbi:nucleotidyltransferase family protein [Chloroflexi bacterium TSY]|nr:nucleotidyltransferase family protein [Chloroflexi bacterium TSY]
MDLLDVVRQCDPPNWYLGAGAVRNIVWDALHGYTKRTPVRDIDVAFFDPDDLTPERDATIQEQLRAIEPAEPWEATNQAAVHLWYEAHFGHSVAPHRSCEEAISIWPETATSIGVRLLSDGRLKIIAPCGLSDLFEMKLRRNPARVSVEQFRKRVREKRILETWPQVELLDQH